MEAKELCMKAAELVGGDRAEQHGDKRENHANIAAFWSEYIRRKYKLNLQLTPSDVATLMELLKIARRLTGKFNLDDFIDSIGYAAIAGSLESKTLEGGGPERNADSRN